MPCCPVCSSQQSELFIVHTAGDCIRCLDCNLVWLEPPPQQDAIEHLYADAYHDATTGYFTKVDRKLARSIGRVRQIRAYLRRDPHGLQFLDVGANGGFMCEAARRAGFEVTGVEPDAHAIHWAQQHYPNIRFVNSFIEHADLDPESFDVAYCSEVIEHSPNCRAFVAAISRTMRLGGLLYITTPNISHWRRPGDITKWVGFNPPAHCVYFSPNNLTQLLANCGLRVVRNRWAFKPGIKLIARREE